MNHVRQRTPTINLVSRDNNIQIQPTLLDNRQNSGVSLLRSHPLSREVSTRFEAIENLSHPCPTHPKITPTQPKCWYCLASKAPGRRTFRRPSNHQSPFKLFSTPSVCLHLFYRLCSKVRRQGRSVVLPGCSRLKTFAQPSLSVSELSTSRIEA